MKRDGLAVGSIHLHSLCCYRSCWTRSHSNRRFHDIFKFPLVGACLRRMSRNMPTKLRRCFWDQMHTPRHVEYDDLSPIAFVSSWKTFLPSSDRHSVHLCGCVCSCSRLVCNMQCCGGRRIASVSASGAELRKTLSLSPSLVLITPSVLLVL